MQRGDAYQSPQSQRPISPHLGVVHQHPDFQCVRESQLTPRLLQQSRSY